MLGLQHVVNNWQNQPEERYHFEVYPDEQVEKETRESLMKFIGDVYPDLLSRVPDLKMSWWYEADGELYAEYHEEPLDQENDGVLLVVRIRPDWRIEYYSCVSNG